MELPLSGIKILDFSHALAGPFCTVLLADYGATVYKVESPEGGDISRGWAPPYAGNQASFYLGLNHSKQGMAINLKDPEGVELSLRMMEKVDVVVENFRPGTLDRIGLGYHQARARNPRLIYCSISGYGQNGPARDQSAMDLILEASCGLISVTGTGDGEQVRCGHSVADITAGMFAMIGILIALRARDHSGAGQLVDVSMFDSMISAMTANFMTYLVSGKVPHPLGTAFAHIVPYCTFPAKDRAISLAAGSEKLWAVLCRAIDHPELIDHPDYATNALRIKNRGVLEPMLAHIFRQDTADNWFRKLNAVGFPCSLVRTLDEVVQDPQAAVREMFPVLQHPTAGRFTVTGLPIKFSETPGRVMEAAPLLGQHTREALSELLDLDPAKLEDLEAAGVILQATAYAAQRT
jgi:crotonobetainyl-CoA:carnitine CoA-transferase CaiB-like acyl-CoA transferase